MPVQKTKGVNVGDCYDQGYARHQDQQWLYGEHALQMVMSNLRVTLTSWQHSGGGLTTGLL